MKGLGKIAIWVGVVSWVIGIISRVMVKPIAGLESRAFAGFAALCFLFAIAAIISSEK